MGPSHRMDAAALVSQLLDGRAEVGEDGRLRLRALGGGPLAGKLRRAYEWIASRAVRPAYRDLHPVPPDRVGPLLEVPCGPAYASFLLLPLLTLATGRRLLLLGAPGRGKTSVAVLMGMLAGYSPQELQRAVQRGHPQLTVADLLGSPLPGTLVDARSAAEIRVEWRRWLTMGVKVVDEYNRIPTKTQSALLSLMSEGYAECYEQVVECGPSAWFLTANDDLGGGTFPVIAALRDRIDAVARCHPLQTDGVEQLVGRVEGEGRDALPPELVFTPDELARLRAEVREVPFPGVLRRQLAMLAAQLEFCGRASPRLEHMSKDSLRLGGRSVAHVCNEECPLDRHRNLCAQVDAGISARALEAAVHYAKALAYFTGAPVVGRTTLQAVLPWVLHERLAPNPQAPVFEQPGGAALLIDRVAWIASLVEISAADLDASEGELAPLRALEAEVAAAEEAGERAELEVLGSRVRARLHQLAGGEIDAIAHHQALRLRALLGRTAAALRGPRQVAV